MNFRLVSLFLAGIASIFLPFTISIAKPNSKKPVSISNTLNLGDGTKFVFQECTQISNQDKVICSGIFRNSNGEKLVYIGRVDDNNIPATSITNSSGKNYVADEIRIAGVDSKICHSKDNCSLYDVNLVEGVEYKTLFVFSDVSLSSAKIPLLSIGFSYNGNAQSLKFRNITVNIQK